MNLNHILATTVITLALSTTACARSEPEQQPAAPAQKEMSHEGMEMKDCDMQGMDMSKMSAEEHAAMMEKCQQSNSKMDGHTDHSHDSQGGQ